MHLDSTNVCELELRSKSNTWILIDLFPFFFFVRRKLLKYTILSISTISFREWKYLKHTTCLPLCIALDSWLLGHYFESCGGVYVVSLARHITLNLLLLTQAYIAVYRLREQALGVKDWKQSHKSLCERLATLSQIFVWKTDKPLTTTL